MPLDPARFAPDHDWDVAIVGGGPAGLACALTLGRAGRRVALFDDGRARNASARHAQGLLTRDGTPPFELRDVGRAECRRYGVHLRDVRVDDATPLDDGAGYRLRVGGDALTARMLVLASGVEDVLPEIPGLDACWGETAIHCPYCHGHELRDRPTAVLGGSNAVGFAVLLLGWTSDLTLVPQESALTATDEATLAARGIAVQAGRVAKLAHTDGVVEAVVMDDGARLPVGAVYVQPPQRPRSALAQTLGLSPKDGAACFVADDDGRVALPGLFLCGDVSAGTQNLASAIDEGTRVGIAVNHELIVGPPASAV